MANDDVRQQAAKAFEEAEMANLRVWMTLSGGQKVDFFEEMIELAYYSGALRPERLAMRDESSDAMRDGSFAAESAL